MLFELGGKRKRFIQVIYVFLALLLGVGLVGLGIGGDANGGIFNALGIGGDDASQSDPQFDDRIERAEATLAANPDDEQALLALAEVHYLAGQSALELDPVTSDPIGLTEESIAEYELAVESWEDYLATKPPQMDDGIAGLMYQAYLNLAGTSSSQSVADQQIERALEAAQVVSEASPSVGSFQNVAFAAFAAGETKIAEQAREDALAEASDSTTRSQVRQFLAQAEAQAKARKLAEKQPVDSDAAEEQLQDPLGGLGGEPPATGAPSPLPGG